jgi:L-fucose isomerase-like protein
MADPATEVRGTVPSNRQVPFLFEFPLKPGRVSLARLHRRGLRNGLADYRLVIGGGEMVRAPQSFSGTSGVIRFDRPAGEVLDNIMDWGLEHHMSITYGDVRPALRAFAKLVGLDVLELT